MESPNLFNDPSCYRGTMMFLRSGDIRFGGSSMMSMDETAKKRPFFSSPEELFDDECYDEQLPEKKRRLTPEQVLLLEKSFEAENKLEPVRKSQLANKLGLQPRQVAVWFQNRRARWKTKQLERDFDTLKSSYDSLLLKHEFTLKENEKLKSEVVSLNEKLQAKDVPITPIFDQKIEPLPVETVQFSALPFSMRVEDRLSSGSGVSSVVDSKDSYFPADSYTGYIACVNGVQSEDDDGSDDGRSYFSDVFVAPESHGQNHEAVDTFGWWVWS